jgi:hypothetical protein
MGLKGNNSQLLIYVVAALVTIAVFAYLLGRRSVQKVSLLAICFLLVLFLSSKFSLADELVVTANVTQGCGDKICNSTQGESCSSCPTDCGSCSPGSSGTVYHGGGGGCSYNWTCTRWSECVKGIQTRTCYNNGTCKDNKGKPVESQSCSVTTVPINITPSTTTSTTIEQKTTTTTIPSAPVTPLGLGIGVIVVIAISGVMTLMVLKKRRKIKK